MPYFRVSLAQGVALAIILIFTGCTKNQSLPFWGGGGGNGIPLPIVDPVIPSETSIELGNRSVEDETTATVILSNLSSDTVTALLPTLNNPSSALMTLSANNCEATLLANQSCQLTLKVTPRALGNVSAALTLSYVRRGKSFAKEIPVRATAVNPCPDVAFGTTGKFTNGLGRNYVTGTLAMQPDGKFIAGGAVIQSDLSAHLALVRVRCDGTLDPDFGTAGVATSNQIVDISQQQNLALQGGHITRLQKDGKILLLALHSPQDGVKDVSVARFLTNGMIDTTFGNGGTFTIRFPVASGSSALGILGAMSVLDDGKILVSGSTFLSPRVFFLRLLANGTLDNTFGTNGLSVIELSVSSVAIGQFIPVENGSVLAIGNRSFAPGVSVLKIKANGTLDSTYGALGVMMISNVSQPAGISNFARLQPDGNVVMGVCLPATNAPCTGGVLRIMSNGTLDPSFGSGGIVATNYPGGTQAVGLQADGKIVFAIVEQSSGGAVHVIRVGTNGALDNTFGNAGHVQLPSPASLAFAYNVIPRVDGKIFISVGARFATAAATTLGGHQIIRLNANGSL